MPVIRIRRGRHGIQCLRYMRYVIAVLVAVVLEVGVFNTPHWKSLHTAPAFEPTVMAASGLKAIPAKGTSESQGQAQHQAEAQGQPQAQDPAQPQAQAASPAPATIDPDVDPAEIPGVIDGGDVTPVTLPHGSEKGPQFEVADQTPPGFDPADKGTAYLLLDTRGEHVSFVTLDLVRTDTIPSPQHNQLTVQITVADAYNGNGVRFPRATVSPVTAQSSRLSVVTGGGSPWMRVRITDPNGTRFRIDRIVINEAVPFSFNPWRFAALLFIALAVALLLPGSWMWRVAWNAPFARNRGRGPERGRNHIVSERGRDGLPQSHPADITPAVRVGSWLVLAAIVAAQILLMLLAFKIAAPRQLLQALNGQPNVAIIYQDQVRAILAGHAWLDRPIPDALLNMANPYDHSVRDAVTAGASTPVIPDYAYKDGHYWSYFGIMPVWLMMLPCFALTGVIPPTWGCVLVLLVLTIPASLWLVCALVRRYAPRASFGTVASMFLAFPALTFLPMLAGDPRTYALPNAMAVLLCVCGFASWLTAIRVEDSVTEVDTDEIPYGDHIRRPRGRVRRAGTLRAPWIAAGSLMMGLTLGARPTMSVMALLAVPLFWPQLRHCRTLIRVRDWVAMLLPPALAAAPVLWWNMVRFGSWLDFGASYNLTNVNMTGHPGAWESLPLRLFETLLRPISADFSWPFIQLTDMPYSYQGGISSFSMMGGYFSFVPVAALGLVAAWCGLRRRASNRDAAALAGDVPEDASAGAGAGIGAGAGAGAGRAAGHATGFFVVAASGLALALMLIVTQIGGFSPRYDTDWALAVAMVAVIGVATLDEELVLSRWAAKASRAVRFVGVAQIGSTLRFLVGMLALVSMLVTWWYAFVTYNLWSTPSNDMMFRLRSVLMPS